MSTIPSPLRALATRISKNVEAITTFCESTGHPQRSLGQIDVDTLLPSGASSDLQRMKQDLVDAALELQLLTTDVREFWDFESAQNSQFACIRWLCHFRIPIFVTLDGTCSYASVATAASVPEDQLRRISRMAMLANFLTEPSPGQLGHSSISAACARDSSMLEWGNVMTDLYFPMTAAMVEATERWGTTEAHDQSAYQIAFKTDLPVFQHAAQNPDLSARIGSFMKNQAATNPGISLKHLINGFDWSSLDSSSEAVTVVDVGGSMGHASVALARAFPRLRFVVQDLENTVQVARDAMSSLDLSDEVASRISFEAHDFFAPQPAILQRGGVGSGADTNVFVFFLRMILHDWPDAKCAVILRHLASFLRSQGPAVASRGRILIMDTVLPGKSTTASSGDANDNSSKKLESPQSPLSRVEEAKLRLRDLMMMQAHNAREREYDEWVALLARADKELRLKNVVRPEGSDMAVLEVELSS